jgi:hypothetical protein
MSGMSPWLGDRHLPCEMGKDKDMSGGMKSNREQPLLHLTGPRQTLPRGAPTTSHETRNEQACCAGALGPAQTEKAPGVWGPLTALVPGSCKGQLSSRPRKHSTLTHNTRRDMLDQVITTG